MLIKTFKKHVSVELEPDIVFGLFYCAVQMLSSMFFLVYLFINSTHAIEWFMPEVYMALRIVKNFSSFMSHVCISV